jgi:ferrochelatase
MCCEQTSTPADCWQRAADLSYTGAMKTGLLLINLGTPDAPTVDAVRRYLDEFLMDPYVVDIPFPLRYLLVKGIILRTRPQASAKLYQSVWTDKGSPLLVLSLELEEQIKALLNEDFEVELGMRYGSPSVAVALEKLMQHELEQLIVLPLFPQYSQAATESAIQSFKKAFKKYNAKLPVRIITDFYDHPAFIDSYVKIIEKHLDISHHEHLLLSYHGLPVKHLEKTGCEYVGKHCIDETNCPKMNIQNKNCYKAQCFATSRLIAKQLNLTENQYSVSFQSRLGKTPWIKPYTDLHLSTLYNKGIRKLAIASPSFVSDCLETLEEIAIQAKEQWLALGGESLTVIPCLNTSTNWVKAISKIIE